MNQVLYFCMQEKAWCDERVMKHWINVCWKPNVHEESMLVLDVHKAQMTESVQAVLTDKCDTLPVYVPGGCTPLVQPLDVVINAPLKKKIEKLSMQHVQENLQQYVNGKFTASERRVLLTSWIGQAWEELSSNKSMIIRAFKKCGISVAADGSEDDEVEIMGLEKYEIGFEESDSDEDSTTGEDGADKDQDSDYFDDTESDDTDTDPFADVESDAQ